MEEDREYDREGFLFTDDGFDSQGDQFENWYDVKKKKVGDFYWEE